MLKINSFKSIYANRNIFKGEVDSRANLVSQNIDIVPSNNKSFVSASNLLAYVTDFKNSRISKSSNLNILYPISLSIKDSKYSTNAKNCMLDLASRAGKSGQVLNWIDVLPNEQLSRIDEIYDLANFMKQNGSKKLGIIGIGGSKHTIENMLSLNSKMDNVVFLSAVDKQSIDNFVKKIGDLDNAVIMVASKSGTTLEPSVGFEKIQQIFFDRYKSQFEKDGLSSQKAFEQAKEKLAKHFVCITDKDENKSKLRKIAIENNMRCGIIHDDCGGRFGAFDDHTLVALAWAGMSKEDMKTMLNSALSSQQNFLNSNINENKALQRAIFNVDCVLNGKVNQHDYYFGDCFEGTKLWNTQLKKESHKSLYRVSGDLLGPEFLHNSTESDLDSANTTSFYTFYKIKNDKSRDFVAHNALIDGSIKAYSQKHPLSIIELNNLSPETIGEFVELKHFETIYTGMLLRSLKNNSNTTLDVLPEVLQPNVSIYKKEVNKILQDNVVREKFVIRNNVT